MDIADAQKDMRSAYFGGAPGLLVSAAVWFAAGVVALSNAPKNALLTLFFGGMLIHPAAVLLAKAMGRSGAHARGNPLGRLALEGTFLLLLGLALAYAASLPRVERFFPAMLLVIGGRYLTFSTLYGLRLYWACGALLAVAGFALDTFDASLAAGAFTGAAIEGVFGAVVCAIFRRERNA